MDTPEIKGIRSRYVVKKQNKQKIKIIEQRPEDLDFGYLDDLNRQKMFTMIRMGYGERQSPLVHNYNRIPTYPRKKENKSASPLRVLLSPIKGLQKCDTNTNIIGNVSNRTYNDPYQMEMTHHKMLGNKMNRISKINRRILEKFSV